MRRSSRWCSWPTPKQFKEELVPKPRGVEVNIHFLLLEDVDSGPDSANHLRHEHGRQVIGPPSAFGVLLWNLKWSASLVSRSLPDLKYRIPEWTWRIWAVLGNHGIKLRTPTKVLLNQYASISSSNAVNSPQTTLPMSLPPPLELRTISKDSNFRPWSSVLSSFSPPPSITCHDSPSITVSRLMKILFTFCFCFVFHCPTGDFPAYTTT